MTDETVGWLVQEVEDLLDVSSVGLYEFLELLGSERRDVARLALDRLLAGGGVGLFEMRWPEPEHVRELDSVPADPWGRPGSDGRYVAIDRAE